MLITATAKGTAPVVVARGAIVYVRGLPYVAGERVEVPAEEARAWVRDGFACPVPA